MRVATGFGYLTFDGKIIAKYELRPGDHPDLPQGFKYTEVKDKVALDKVSVDQTSEQRAQEQKNNQRKALKESAEIKLKNLGLSDEEIKVIVS